MHDRLDNFVSTQIRGHHLPGLSLAVVGGDGIIRAQSCGFTDQTRKSLVTPATLFQAASLSKCLAALAALRLVDRGWLALDADLNTRLQSWKIPPSEFVKNEPVTLRRLLSHSAGFTVPSFSGYVAGQPIPTLTQILNGTLPARNPAVGIDTIPGTQCRYSGGGYTVLQQLLVDVTGQPFPELMQTLVLQPLGMTASTFDQTLPPDFAPLAAAGHSPNGRPVNGGAHVYPEMAAAGLWSTPSDLARFVRGIQQSFAGQDGSILSSAVAREMLTLQAAPHGLGPQVSGSGKDSKFFHSGRNAGFDSLFMAHAEIGRNAVVIMINANTAPQVLGSILKGVLAVTS